MENEARRPLDPGCEVWSRPAGRNRARSNVGTREETASLKVGPNSGKVSHSQGGYPFASINSCLDFHRLRRRNQGMEVTKEQGHLPGKQFAKKIKPELDQLSGSKRMLSANPKCRKFYRTKSSASSPDRWPRKHKRLRGV